MSGRDVASDRGSISAFVVIVMSALIACAGLVVDGGRRVTDTVRAADHAGAAARVGAQQISSVRGGVLTIDPHRAMQAAQRYLDARRLTGDVQATSVRVTVTVQISTPTALLHLVGVDRSTVRVTRSAVVVIA